MLCLAARSLRDPDLRLPAYVARKLMRPLCALIFLLGLSAGALGQTLPEPRVVRINDRVYVLLGPVQHANRLNQGYMINSTVIVGDKGVILIDSGGTEQVGRHISTAGGRITDKPVTHVVNTHHHGDHYLGNVAFTGAAINLGPFFSAEARFFAGLNIRNGCWRITPLACSGAG